jgi:circadian clock protein KaiB
MPKAISSTKQFEAASGAAAERYVLRLYIAGSTPGSSRAVETLKAICEEHLPNRYELEVVDIYQQPMLARDEQIIAVPTLIKKLPLPIRKLLGDLSDKQRVLLGLDLKPQRHEKKRRAKKER